MAPNQVCPKCWHKFTCLKPGCARSPNFKPDQWVVCVQAFRRTALTRGKAYRVTAVRHGRIQITNDHGKVQEYSWYRFKRQSNGKEG